MNDSQFRQRLRQFFHTLRLGTWGETLVVHQGDTMFFEFEPGQGGGVQVNGPHTNAHRKTLGEAFDLVWQLLRGEARSVEEYRNGVLAATWIELREGDVFERRDLAAHLPPYDEAEWTPWPGEVWRTRRYSYEMGFTQEDGECVLLGFFDVEGAEPQGACPDAFGWFDAALGPPQDGFRWTNGPDGRCMLQAPKLWRRLQEEGEGYVDFVSQSDEHFLRIATYYCEPSQPCAPARSVSFLSTGHAYEFAEMDGWACDRHTLTFQGDDLDMLAILEAYWPAADGEPAGFRDSIRATAPLTRMTPLEWSIGSG